MSKKSEKKLTHKSSGFWVLIAIIAIIAIVVNMPGDKSDEQKAEGDSIHFSEEEMEKFCQEDHVVDINGYFESVGVDYSMINILNYNKYFNPEYMKTNDGSERPIALLSWNGKNNDEDKPISFMCWATKDENGEQKLLLLESDMHTIRGLPSDIYGE